jgi:hypothetical protein
LKSAGRLVAACWTQNADARAADGSAVDPWDNDAVCWSLLGALVASYERLLTLEDETVALSALAMACLLLAEVIDSDSLAEWNDLPERTHPHVLAAINTAARRKLETPAEPPFSPD